MFHWTIIFILPDNWKFNVIDLNEVVQKKKNNNHDGWTDNGMWNNHHIAYLRVHSLASSLYFSLSVLYILAISGTSGSSGFGSQSNEQIDNKTKNKNVLLIINNVHIKNRWNCVLPLEMVNAGDHWDRRISRQMLPLLLMFGW